MAEPEDIRIISFPLPGTRFADVEVRRRQDGRSVRLGNGRRSRAVGRYFSIKNGGGQPWESRPELFDLYHAEVDGSVVSFRTQPETLAWRCDGGAWRYTPDRIDVLEDGSHRVVEIKDEYDAERDPAYAAKLDQAREIYGLLGRAFSLRTRADILAEPLFSAVEEAQAYRRAVVTTEQALHVRDRLSQGPLPFGILMRSLPGGHPRESIMAMAVRRIIRLDYAEGLSPQTPVHLIDGPTS